MWPNPQETADLVKFTEEILNGKFHFCAVWVCTNSSVSSIGRPDTVCNIWIAEVKCFKSQRCYLVLPAWNSTLRFVSCILSIHTSSCGISSLWNDMAAGVVSVDVVVERLPPLLWWLIVILIIFLAIV